MAFFGEQVLIAFTLARFAIGLAFQHAVLDEDGESFAEQGSCAADVDKELLEAARAIKRLADHEQRPLLPDDARVRLIERSRTRSSSKLGRLCLLEVGTAGRAPILAEFDIATQPTT